MEIETNFGEDIEKKEKFKMLNQRKRKALVLPSD